MKSLCANLCLLLWLSYSVIGLVEAADPAVSPALKRARLYVVASESMFATVNQGDAVASMSVWIKQLGAMRGFQCETKMEIAQSIAQIRHKLSEHAVDLLVLDTPDYLALAKAGLVEALAVGTSRGQLAAFQYILLTNDASGSMQLAGLRGKRTMVASRTKSNMGLVWLEALLAENRLGLAASFFGSVEITNRPSPCVLSLFFGKIDACVVDSGNFESVKELNPQLGRLRVVAHSEALLEGLLAMPVRPQNPKKREVIDAILNLHKAGVSEQLGIIFKVGSPGARQYCAVRIGGQTVQPVSPAAETAQGSYGANCGATGNREGEPIGVPSD
jgi:ABC-type phosphate/phosphonate transport system substrate-binding protein